MARPAKTSPKNQPAPKKPAGRPSSYSEEIATIICERIIAGQSLRTICADDALPSKSTVLLWLTKIDDFRTKYAHAREAQGDALLEEMGEIEDDLIAGKIDPSAGRSALWSKQWRATRQAPKKYGDKLTLSGDAQNPLAMMIAAVQGTAIKPVEK